MTHLGEKQERVLGEINKLMAELDNSLAEQKLKEDDINRFQKEIDLCYYTRSRAAKLLNELNGERQKWQVNKNVTIGAIRNLEGDCLMAAFMVCYLAPFT